MDKQKIHATPSIKRLPSYLNYIRQVQEEGYEFLMKNGMKVIDDYTVCKTFDEVWEAIEKIGQKRGELGYDIDGAVVKLNSIAARNQLGQTSKVPKFSYGCRGFHQ